MRYSVYKLNKQSDNIQPCIPFPILNQPIVSCLVLTLDPYTGKVVCHAHLFKNFPVCCDPQSQNHSIVIEGEVDVFLEFPWFLHHPENVGNLISGSSTFPKPSWYIWKFLVHVLLKPRLKDFEHYLASIKKWVQFYSSLNIFWHYPSLGLEWKLFSVLWSLLSFLNLLRYWVQHFSSIF